MRGRLPATVNYDTLQYSSDDEKEAQPHDPGDHSHKPYAFGYGRYAYYC